MRQGVPEPEGDIEWVWFRPTAEEQIKQHPLTGSGSGGQGGGLDWEGLQMRREGEPLSSPHVFPRVGLSRRSVTSPGPGARRVKGGAQLPGVPP